MNGVGRFRLPVLAALALLLAPALDAKCLIQVTLAGQDRNGPPLEAGDTVEWTVHLVQHLDWGGARWVTATLEPGQRLETVGQNGSYDPETRTLSWDEASSPGLGRISPRGATFVLTFSTIVEALDTAGRACVLGHYRDVEFGECYWGFDSSGCRSDDPMTPLANDSSCIPTPAPFVLSGIAPCRLPEDGTTPVVLEGAGFDDVTYVAFGRAEATVIEVTPTQIQVRPPLSINPGLNDVTVYSPHHTATLRDTFLGTSAGAEPDSLRVAETFDGYVRLVFAASRTITIERAREPLFGCETISSIVADAPEVLDDPDWQTPFPDTRVWFYRAD